MRGYANHFQFPNGYGLSVISHELSMGGKHGYFELSVTHGEKGKLCYATPVMDAPMGWLSFDEVTPYIELVTALGENPLCNHKRRQLPMDDEPTLASGNEADDDGSLGSCGCIDYHYADCDTRLGASNGYDAEYQEDYR